MTTVLPPTFPRPWRRFLRFSVRGLTILVLVIGASLGWIVRKRSDSARCRGGDRESWRHRFLRLGLRDGHVSPWGKPIANAWLVDHVGIDYFDHVIAVELSESSTPTDSVFSQVGRLHTTGTFQ